MTTVGAATVPVNRRLAIAAQVGNSKRGNGMGKGTSKLPQTPWIDRRNSGRRNRQGAS